MSWSLPSSTTQSEVPQSWYSMFTLFIFIAYRLPESKKKARQISQRYSQPVSNFSLTKNRGAPKRGPRPRSQAYICIIYLFGAFFIHRLILIPHFLCVDFVIRMVEVFFHLIFSSNIKLFACLVGRIISSALIFHLCTLLS